LNKDAALNAGRSKTSACTVSRLSPERGIAGTNRSAKARIEDSLRRRRDERRGNVCQSLLQGIATLPLDVVDDATPVELRRRLMEMNPGWRAMKRVHSVINDNASACFPGSGPINVN
jgi:hypothetical protein